jgi:hypothetical protein
MEDEVWNVKALHANYKSRAESKVFFCACGKLLNCAPPPPPPPQPKKIIKFLNFVLILFIAHIVDFTYT